MGEMLSDESMDSQPDDQTEATVAQENRADRVWFGAFGLGSSRCRSTGRSQGRAPCNGRGSCMIYFFCTFVAKAVSFFLQLLCCIEIITSDE